MSWAKFIFSMQYFEKYIGLLCTHLGKSVLYFLHSEDIRIFASTYLTYIYLLQGMYNITINSIENMKTCPLASGVPVLSSKLWNFKMHSRSM